MKFGIKLNNFYQDEAMTKYNEFVLNIFPLNNLESQQSHYNSVQGEEYAYKYLEKRRYY